MTHKLRDQDDQDRVASDRVASGGAWDGVLERVIFIRLRPTHCIYTDAETLHTKGLKVVSHREVHAPPPGKEYVSP